MAVFDNLPNFRPAGGYGLTNKRGQRVKEGLLYRSSRTDSITLKDRSLLLQLGIKSTVDIRGEKNYRRLTSKPLQDLYTPCVIRNGERCSVSKQVKKHGEREAVGFNYLFDIYTHQLSRHIFNQANIFLRLFSFVFILPIDLLLGTCLMSYLFGRFVVRYLSLSRQYIDYLEFGKPVIAEMMNLLLSPQQNLPMLIHCAYGKDRTGLMIALILDCIEVDDDAIIQDYTQSEVIIATVHVGMMFY